jgi:DNA-binding transcriptional LysR family regulator
VDLREVECFLAVADELHFGRAAERMFLSQSAVSEAVRRLESELGGQLFERTSRRVVLTDLGRRFRVDVEPPFRALRKARDEARQRARGVELVLRAGFLGGGLYQRTRPLIDAVERGMPSVELRLVEIDFADHTARIREGSLDCGFLRLPVEEPDLTVSTPVLIRDQRVLAVATDHRLASYDIIEPEELAHETLISGPDAAPAYWIDYHLPSTTPLGRPIRRGPSARTVQETLSLVAAGRVVHPLDATASAYYGRPDVRFVPIDLPPVETALVWRRSDQRQVLRELSRIATAICVAPA